MISSIKKTKYQQIAEVLERREGFISDQDIYNIYDCEDGLWKAQEHIRIWKKLQADRKFFKDKRIIEKEKGHRCHLVRIEGQNDGSFYKVGKQFYNEVTI